MQRITNEDLNSVVSLINKMSKNDKGVALGSAYGRVQLYLIDKKEYKENHTMIQSLTSGTT